MLYACAQQSLMQTFEYAVVRELVLVPEKQLLETQYNVYGGGIADVVFSTAIGNAHTVDATLFNANDIDKLCPILSCTLSTERDSMSTHAFQF